MNPTVLTAVSAAALVLAIVVAVGLVVQSRRLHRLRDELGVRDSDVASLRSELDTVRRCSGSVDVVDVVRPAAPVGRSEPSRPAVPRPRAATSPTAWRRARSGGTAVRTRRNVAR